jgi:hypothetical protein
VANFESRFLELTFYVNGEAKHFNQGAYHTENEQEISVLEKLTDVKRVDSVKEPVKKAQAKPKDVSKK